MVLDTNIKNFRVNPDEDTVSIYINPKIYPLEVIYSAAYIFIDRAYVLLDGDPENEIIVVMKSKINPDQDVLEKLAMDFNNELLHYAVYVIQAARNRGLREAIVRRALATNLEENVDYADDPEGIAKPWSPNKEDRE